MRNSNFMRAALAMGAMTLIAGCANAQSQNTNGATNNGANNNGTITRNPYTNGAGGIYGTQNYNYGNPFYGGGYYGDSFYGNPYYGGGYYDAYYVLGGNSPYGGAYGDVNAVGNNAYNPYPASDPYSGNNANNFYGNPGYGNNGYSDNGYYGNGGYYNGGSAGYVGPNVPNGAANRVSNPGYNGQPVARVLPRTTDTLEAKRVKGDKFYIGWKGDNNAVNKITFAMLDLNKRAIMTRTVTQPPGECTFPITSRMVYYQVVVEYVNGTTNTVTSPL